MTREEALKMAKAELKCMERDTSGQDEMCNSHKCDECSLNYERGNMGEQKEWLRMAIKALETQLLDLEGLKNDMKALNCGYPYGLDYLLDCLKNRLGITIIEADGGEEE